MKNLIFVVILGLVLTGCAVKKSEKRCDPSPTSKTEIRQSETYRPGYKVLAYDRPGLVGKIAAAPGHVLTTGADQDYSEIERQISAQKVPEPQIKRKPAEIKTSTLPVLVPENKRTPPPQTRKKHPVDTWRQAWERYCNNGEGMTDDDIKILEKANYKVPAVFQDDCHPPK